MASIFDGGGFFWGLSNRPRAKIGDTGVFQSVTPIGSPLTGGFPGIYPGMGPGQSGAAGLVEFLERQKKCMESGKCPVVWGPSAIWG
jgi:hypothetical protein